MNALIPIEQKPVSGETIQTVNARELHAFLEVKSAFKDWIARRIEDFGFIEGQDFCSFLRESTGGRPTKEYALTLSMGKELSMVERNEKGKQARQYFIECEKIAKQPQLNPANLSRMQLIQIAMESEQERLLLAEKVEELAPKAEIADRIHTSDGLFGFRQVAKMIAVNENKFRNWLIQNDWVYYLGKRMTGKHYPIKAGYIVEKIKLVQIPGEEEMSIREMYFTPKGLHRLAMKFDKQMTLV